ncbi:MAG TPA: peptidoglycan DD-metalloendopeptidase family protein [archaeon]|nr:peptidoglycan DD-metalloendopeptidase family protein [archaeon]
MRHSVMDCFTCRFITFCLALMLLGSWRDSPAQKEKIRQAEVKIKTSKSQLEKIEGEIEAKDARAKVLEKKEQSIIRQIYDYERKIDESKKTLKGLNSEIGEITTEINYIDRQLENYARKLEEKKKILYLRLRGIYKQGQLHNVSVLLGSHSYTDLLKRFKYLTLIAAQDKRLVHEVSDLQHTYSEYKRLSERKLALRIERKAQLETEQQKLETAEAERQKLLETVKAQRAEVLKALEQRKADKDRILSTIAEWERRRLEAIEQAKREGRVLPPETSYLEGKKGQLIWPVPGGKMIRGFGPYRDEITNTRIINNGIDIKAEYGENVVSVAEGSVVLVEWYRSYGKTVFIYHGAGMYSSYTHLGDVFVDVGDFVSGGQKIASVGSTGSLEGPMLHFEIREGAKTVDPMLWLAKKL